MVPSNLRVVNLTVPATLAAAGMVTGQIDTLGYNYASFAIIDGAVASAATAMTTISWTESDTIMTAATAGTDIVALTGAATVSSTAGFVLPSPSTATVVPVGCVYQFNVNLIGRKRYIACQVIPAVSAALSVVGILGRAPDPAKLAITSPITNSTQASQLHLIADC